MFTSQNCLCNLTVKLSTEPGFGLCLSKTILRAGAEGAALGSLIHETEPAAAGGDGRAAEQAVAAAKVNPAAFRGAGPLPSCAAAHHLLRYRGRVRASDHGRLRAPQEQIPRRATSRLPQRRGPDIRLRFGRLVQ